MEYLCTPQNACLRIYAMVNFTISAFLSPFFPDSFGHSKSLSPECKWLPLWKKNNGKRESILLLQILRKMVCINYCGNFTTFIITLISPIEISVLKKKINFMAFLVITWWLFLLILRGALRIIGSCLFVQGSA